MAVVALAEVAISTSALSALTGGRHGDRDRLLLTVAEVDPTYAMLAATAQGHLVRDRVDGTDVVGHLQRHAVRADRAVLVGRGRVGGGARRHRSLHSYDAMVPSGSDEPVPSKVQDSAVQVLVKAAVGGTSARRDVDRVGDARAPPLSSVTVRVTS